MAVSRFDSINCMPAVCSFVLSKKQEQGGKGKRDRKMSNEIRFQVIKVLTRSERHVETLLALLITLTVQH